MDVFNKHGKKMNEWEDVSQLPELWRLHPKCKGSLLPATRRMTNGTHDPRSSCNSFNLFNGLTDFTSEEKYGFPLVFCETARRNESVN